MGDDELFNQGQKAYLNGKYVSKTEYYSSLALETQKREELEKLVLHNVTVANTLLKIFISIVIPLGLVIVNVIISNVVDYFSN